MPPDPVWITGFAGYTGGSYHTTEREEGGGRRGEEGAGRKARRVRRERERGGRKEREGREEGGSRRE